MTSQLERETSAVFASERVRDSEKNRNGCKKTEMDVKIDSLRFCAGKCFTFN